MNVRNEWRIMWITCTFTLIQRQWKKLLPNEAAIIHFTLLFSFGFGTFSTLPLSKYVTMCFLVLTHKSKRTSDSVRAQCVQWTNITFFSAAFSPFITLFSFHFAFFYLIYYEKMSAVTAEQWSSVCNLQQQPTLMSDLEISRMLLIFLHCRLLASTFFTHFLNCLRLLEPDCWVHVYQILNGAYICVNANSC